MIKPSVTVAEVVALLNELVKLDPAAMNALVESRVHCNDAFADHPTVQVSSRKGGNGEDGFEVGLLGILNGIFGTDPKGWGPIAACFNEGVLYEFIARPVSPPTE